MSRACLQQVSSVRGGSGRRAKGEGGKGKGERGEEKEDWPWWRTGGELMEDWWRRIHAPSLNSRIAHGAEAGPQILGTPTNDNRQVERRLSQDGSVEDPLR